MRTRPDHMITLGEFHLPATHIIFSFLDMQSIARLEGCSKSFRKIIMRDAWPIVQKRMPHHQQLPAVIHGLEGGSARQVHKARQLPSRKRSDTTTGVILRPAAAAVSAAPTLPYVLSPKMQVRLYHEARKAAVACTTVSMRPTFPRESSKYLIYVRLSGEFLPETHPFRRHPLVFNRFLPTLYEGVLHDLQFHSGCCTLSLPRAGLDRFRSQMKAQMKKCEMDCEHDNEDAFLRERRKTLFRNGFFQTEIVAMQLSLTRMMWRQEFAIVTVSMGSSVDDSRCNEFHHRHAIEYIGNHDVVKFRIVKVSLFATDDFCDLDRLVLRVPDERKEHPNEEP